jgi:hypothetical protein
MNKLGRFVVEMHKKFKERAIKYPDNESLTDDSFDWVKYPTRDIEIHFIQEIFERFPNIATDDSCRSKLTCIQKMNEDIDIANMAFADYTIRKARLEKAAQEARMKEVLEISKGAIKDGKDH